LILWLENIKCYSYGQPLLLNNTSLSVVGTVDFQQTGSPIFYLVYLVILLRGNTCTLQMLLLLHEHSLFSQEFTYPRPTITIAIHE